MTIFLVHKFNFSCLIYKFLEIRVTDWNLDVLCVTTGDNLSVLCVNFTTFDTADIKKDIDVCAQIWSMSLKFQRNITILVSFGFWLKHWMAYLLIRGNFSMRHHLLPWNKEILSIAVTGVCLILHNLVKNPTKIFQICMESTYESTNRHLYAWRIWWKSPSGYSMFVQSGI